MIEISYEKEQDFDYELRALIAGFFPKQTFGGGTGEQLVLKIRFALEQTCIRIRVQMEGYEKERQVPVSGAEDFKKHPDRSAHPYRTYYKNQLKRLLYQMLAEIPDEVLPEGFEKRLPAWGTMTGVRPTKIPMQELLSGRTETEVLQVLRDVYCCSEKKRTLCMEIAQKEAELLRGQDLEQGYSLYVGIPFCPTTCLYCSFPSYSMERFAGMTERYLGALFKELHAACELCAGHPLSSVYIGGGTPTALSKEQLGRLLSEVRTCFPESAECEFTVEAGRPDSITEGKLEVLKSFGIDRISVNPQTMQQKTLDFIGRKHTVEDTTRAFRQAREYGFGNINMDLIVGLPGENLEDFSDTLRQVEALEPDSITVHSLVIKRASKLREILDEASSSGGERIFSEKQRMEGMARMLEMAQESLRKQGYLPYYMYRQKNSFGHFGSDGQENIGFAKKGKECLYNILIMEEMQTIVAVGAGASTKQHYVENVMYEGREVQSAMVGRIENVKSIQDYIGRIDEMMERKNGLFDKT